MIATTGEIETSALVDYVLRDSKNFRVALAVWQSVDEIKKEIFEQFVDGFVRKLEDGLSRSPADSPGGAGWEIKCPLRSNVFEHWQGIYVRNRRWKSDYLIGMEPQSAYARGFIFGIKRPSEDARTSITEADRQRLNEEFGRGRSSPWWEWYRDVDSRYRDWEGEVLMEIYEKDPAIDFYLNRLANRGLLEFVRQAAAIVERALGRE